MIQYLDYFIVKLCSDFLKLFEEIYFYYKISLKDLLWYFGYMIVISKYLDFVFERFELF